MLLVPAKGELLFADTSGDWGVNISPITRKTARPHAHRPGEDDAGGPAG